MTGIREKLQKQELAEVIGLYDLGFKFRKDNSFNIFMHFSFLVRKLQKLFQIAYQRGIHQSGIQIITNDQLRNVKKYLKKLQDILCVSRYTPKNKTKQNYSKTFMLYHNSSSSQRSN